MKIWLFNLISVFLLSNTAYSSKEEPMPLQSRGGTYSIWLSEPEGEGPFPLLMIAAEGESIEKDKMLASLAKSASEMGFYVVRFNWLWIDQKRSPTRDRTLERKDLEAILDALDAQKNLLNQKRILVLKGQEARTLNRTLAQKLDALYLLDPQCKKNLDLTQSYPWTSTTRTPMRVIIDNKSQLCSPASVLAHANKHPERHLVSIIQSKKTKHSQRARRSTILSWLENDL